MDATLDELLRHPAIWRARSDVHPAAAVIPTGFPALDGRLPGGGWPGSGLIEVLVDQPGTGEFGLVVPALVELHRRYSEAWIVLTQPPYEPYAPALAAKGIDLERLLVIRTAQSLWSMEQALRSGGCRCVLGWLAGPVRIRVSGLRRLQLAAAENGALCILFRPLATAVIPSPAGMRLALRPGAKSLGIRILKCRGDRAGDVSVDHQEMTGG